MLFVQCRKCEMHVCSLFFILSLRLESFRFRCSLGHVLYIVHTLLWAIIWQTKSEGTEHDHCMELWCDKIIYNLLPYIQSKYWRDSICSIAYARQYRGGGLASGILLCTCTQKMASESTLLRCIFYHGMAFRNAPKIGYFKIEPTLNAGGWHFGYEIQNIPRWITTTITF